MGVIRGNDRVGEAVVYGSQREITLEDEASNLKNQMRTLKIELHDAYKYMSAYHRSTFEMPDHMRRRMNSLKDELDGLIL